MVTYFQSYSHNVGSNACGVGKPISSIQYTWQELNCLIVGVRCTCDLPTHHLVISAHQFTYAKTNLSKWCTQTLNSTMSGSIMDVQMATSIQWDVDLALLCVVVEV